MTAWLSANWGYVASALWVACEILNQIPSIQANSVLELLLSALDRLFGGQAKIPSNANIPTQPSSPGQQSP